MGLLNKLFGFGATEVTPNQLAEVLLNGAVQSALHGEGSVHSVLQQAGVELEKSGTYQAELVVYQLFLFDLLVQQTYDEYEDAIRRRLREKFAEHAASSVERSGGDPVSHEEYIAFAEKRFAEYLPAAKRSLNSAGKAEAGSMALAETVYQTITGREGKNPPATYALTVQWMALYGEIQETLREEYEVVSG